MSLTSSIYDQLDLPDKKRLCLSALVVDLEIKIKHTLVRTPWVNFRVSTTTIVKDWCRKNYEGDFTNTEGEKIKECVVTWIDQIEENL